MGMCACVGIGIGVGVEVVGVGIDVVDVDTGKGVVGWKREVVTNRDSGTSEARDRGKVT